MSLCRYCDEWAVGGDVCDECEPKIALMRDGIPQGFDHTKAATCPWCGSHAESATKTREMPGPRAVEADVECPDCWRRFHLSVEVEYHFSTTPIEDDKEAGS